MKLNRISNILHITDANAGVPELYTESVVICDGDIYLFGEKVGHLTKSGTSAQRPSNPIIGYNYFDTSVGKQITWSGTSWIEEDGEVAGIARSGAFANKPTPTNVGFQYFCTSGASIDGGTTEKTNIVIYYTGSEWVDANGNAVVAKA